ncbi:MAG: peptidylprolyl isomerase [Clostridiales bacterium]|jgi:cyclophilin family peptidyl-prolyl cis-trans isomerase|nr:peptidylprolyl isomerase [Clostridiales bacterium]
MPKKQDRQRELTRAERRRVQAAVNGAVTPEAAAAHKEKAAARTAFWRKVIVIAALALAFVLLVTGTSIGVVSCVHTRYDTDNPVAEITLIVDGDEENTLTVRFELFSEYAPVATASFINLARKSFYNGSVVHELNNNYARLGLFTTLPNDGNATPTSVKNARLITADKTERQYRYTFRQLKSVAKTDGKGKPVLDENGAPEKLSNDYKLNEKYYLSTYATTSTDSALQYTAFRICHAAQETANEYGKVFGVVLNDDGESMNTIDKLNEYARDSVNGLPAVLIKIKAVKITANKMSKWRRMDFYKTYTEGSATDADYKYDI